MAERECVVAGLSLLACAGGSRNDRGKREKRHEIEGNDENKKKSENNRET
jgi:hypothetical protein